MSWWLISNLELSFVINPTYTGKFLLGFPPEGWVPCLDILVPYNVSCQLIFGNRSTQYRDGKWTVKFPFPKGWSIEEIPVKRKKSHQGNNNLQAMFYYLKMKGSGLSQGMYWCWKWFNFITSQGGPSEAYTWENQSLLGESSKSEFSNIRHSSLSQI